VLGNGTELNIGKTKFVCCTRKSVAIKTVAINFNYKLCSDLVIRSQCVSKISEFCLLLALFPSSLWLYFTLRVLENAGFDSLHYVSFF
jgi:hypothetical protein